ncbi:conserved membrane hypothetical protein [Verrucomicrobia bacterium]|nr:conserved membrane hypothetical protein [Verrucomicrobiota bacterium]
MRDWLSNHAGGGGTYVLAAGLFVRLLGLIYLVAFASLAVQARGLMGRQGILPADEFLQRRRRWGVRRLYLWPTLCWISGSDVFLVSLAWSGAGLGALLAAGIAPRASLILLWVFYLSLYTVGEVFLGYQWDVLLLEAGFLAIFLAPGNLAPEFPPSSPPSPIILRLFWWLLFRLIFSSGVVKLRSGDLTWRKFTALSYHFETQPLPTPLAWHAHQLPRRWLRVATAGVLAVELLVPFLIFGPARVRHWAAGLIVGLMALIELTGNYGFFNWLAIALSVMLLDDQFLWPFFQWLRPAAEQVVPATPSATVSWPAMAVALVVAGLSVVVVVRLLRLEINWPRPIVRAIDLLEPFRLVNSYGLFAVMTTTRAEIIIEGSEDGLNWQAYDFKWKSGDLTRAPRFVAPHQPRLDWQMWFEALGDYPHHFWFGRLLQRLLEGSPTVLSLLRRNPFSLTPPRFVRALIFDYHFTGGAERRLTGAWWRRQERRFFCPAIGR